jgi:hypothetical protein
VLSSALHFTTFSGHFCLAQGAHAGHDGAAGQFISGQRGRGHGGHSPQSLRQELLSIIIGSGLGMLDFNTYCDKSIAGGHSVFSMYIAKSGHVWQGGTDVFNTYFVISGIGGQESANPSLFIELFIITPNTTPINKSTAI